MAVDTKYYDELSELINSLQELNTNSTVASFIDKVKEETRTLYDTIGEYLNWEECKESLNQIVEAINNYLVCECDCHCGDDEFENINNVIDDIEDEVNDIINSATNNYRIIVDFNKVNVSGFTWKLNSNVSTNTLDSHSASEFLDYYTSNEFNCSTYNSPVTVWTEPSSNNTYTFRFKTLYTPLIQVICLDDNSIAEESKDYRFYYEPNNDKYICFLRFENISKNYKVKIFSNTEITYYKIQFRDNNNYSNVISDLVSLKVDGKTQNLITTVENNNVWYNVVALSGLNQHKIEAVSANNNFLPLVDWTESSVIDGQIFPMFKKYPDTENILNGVFVWYPKTSDYNTEDFDLHIWLKNSNGIYSFGYGENDGLTGHIVESGSRPPSTLSSEIIKFNWDDTSQKMGGSVQTETLTLLNADNYFDNGCVGLWDFGSPNDSRFDYFNVRFKIYYNGANVTPNPAHYISPKSGTKGYWIACNSKLNYNGFAEVNEFYTSSELDMNAYESIIDNYN